MLLLSQVRLVVGTHLHYSCPKEMERRVNLHGLRV